jgi:hypothetical protein
MLYFFLDDSGTDDRSPVITMAGYVAHSHHWAIFDKRAKKLYPCYGITKLHSSDFHGTKGEFAGWTGDKKMEFVRDERYRSWFSALKVRDNLDGEISR